MTHSYWQKQSSSKPLFGDIEWNRPQQKARAGKLAVIGGSKLGFAAVSEAYQTARQTGVGQVRAVLPDALKRSLPPDLLDTVFVPTNESGGFSQDAYDDVRAGLAWADHGLLIGDAGRNSQTAIIFEKLLDTDQPLTITRDAVDLLASASQTLVHRPSTTLVMSFAQTQKLLKRVYYPKVLTFSMPLANLVDVLHKFTITYPITIVTFHQGQLVAAYDGQVVSQELDEPMLIWRGITAAKVASYQTWTPKQPLGAAVASFLA